MIRPANEMSRVVTETPAEALNPCTMGNNECVAKAGASSVIVSVCAVFGLAMRCVFVVF